MVRNRWYLVFEQTLAKARKHFAANPGAAEKLLAIGAARRADGRDPNEHAAWATLALLLLNLDEAMTK